MKYTPAATNTATPDQLKQLQASLRFSRRMGFQLTPEQAELADAADIQVCQCIGCRSGVSCFARPVR